MDIKKIESLASIMEKTGLTSVKIEQDGVKLELERKSEARPLSAPLPVAAVQDTQSAPPAEKVSQADNYHAVLAPTIGVFYAAPSPDSSPYVQVGDKVKKGDVLCIIEAMKLMNEITCEVDGTIVEICVGNGQVVEYDQPLFRIS